MKKNFRVILAVIAVSAVLWSFVPFSNSGDTIKDRELLKFINIVLERIHYNPAEVDDKFSKAVYKNYLDALDPQKRFFVQSDIDEFQAYETKLDDLINNRDLSFFNMTYDRLQKRIREVQVIYKAVNEKPYDFSTDETVSIDHDKNAFPTDYNDLKTRWRLQMKLSVLATVVDNEKTEVSKKEKDPNYSVKNFTQLEKEARETTQKNLKEYFNFIAELTKDDWFEIFVNSIVMQYDPHTSYFAPDSKEKFDQSMSGKLEGIGARLKKSNEYTQIEELISGGPAWKAKELERDDLILKVAQGKGDAVDVVGMKLDDVVKKIKGPKGTEVRLTVKKADGTIKVMSIIRDVVEIEETYAKSSVIEKDGTKYGLIYLPKFYIDFENKDARDAAKDVAIEIQKLKKEGVKGIIMDLRDNGGGSLQTVVDIAGLFIEEGPIVQVKMAQGKKEVKSDHDSRTQWDGPLVVMINNFSASASEIFAAAIQDYKRGLILGSKQSYGKGTVQTVIDLNQLADPTSPRGDYGALKTTTQKFYRINGGSTQLEGVASDIVIPDRYSYIKIGERDMENAMPWDKIDEAIYEPTNSVKDFNGIVAKSKLRIAQNEQFKLIDENAKWINDRKEDDLVTLNIVKFRKEQESIELETKKFKAISKFKDDLKFSSVASEIELIKNDPTLGQKRNEWHENLTKDAYIQEAINVLGDLKGNSAQIIKPLPIKTKKDKLVKS